MHRALPLAAAILVLSGCSWRRPPESIRSLPTTPTPPPAAAPGARLSAEQLDELVARVALYPDALLAILLPASTQPVQIVEAARFLRAREGDPKLTPPAHWEEPVKALLNYPEVVTLMNEDLTWTQVLGDAVATQQSDVMDAIQQVRTRALAAGHLTTNEKWVVTQEQGIIQIESADPKIIYVPIYDPTVIYVASSAPVVTYYPPYPCYWCCPNAAFCMGMMGFNWYYHDIYYDHDHDDDIDIDIDHERPDRPDRPARPDHPDRPGRPERPQGPGRPDQVWKPTRPAGRPTGSHPAARPAPPPSQAGVGAPRPATGGPVGMDKLTTLPATPRESYGGYERGRDATRDSQRGAQSRGLSSQPGSSYGSRPSSSYGGYDRGNRADAWSSRGASSRSSMPSGGYGGGGYRGGGGGGGGRGR